MIPEELFQTETMADILRRQGRLAEAIHIYDSLLKKDPSRTDIAEKLTETRNNLAKENAGGIWTHRLLVKWIEAVLRERHRLRMQHILEGARSDPGRM